MPKQKRSTGKATGTRKKHKSLRVDPEVERVMMKYLNCSVGHWRGEPPEGAGVRRSAGALAGRRLVLAGTFLELTRKEATARIEAAGGSVARVVSARTDYVVVGALAGGALEKARKLGIKLVDERELRRLCRSRTSAAGERRSRGDS